MSIEDAATLGYPMFLLVAIVVSSTMIITGLLIVDHLEYEFKIHELEGTLSSIVSEAEKMYIYADTDSIRILQVELPDILHSAVFGGIPSYNDSAPVFNENSSQYYYYRLIDGRVFLHPTPVRFSIEKPLILHSGRYTLTLKIINEGDEKYVEIESR